MSTHVNTIPPTRTWRDIQQSIAPKAMSSEGRKRLQVATAKTVVVLFVLGLVGWGLFEGMQLWDQNPMAIKSPVKSAPVKFVEVRSDGVLDQAWVTRTLALPKTAGLMELDLSALQTRLLESGQVRTAVLTRKFPETLVVMLEERSPVLRLRAQVGAAAAKDWLVARDGVIYEGVGYEVTLLGTLPYLADVSLKRVQGRFPPIEGMDKVADLLSTAHANVPELYSGWQVVSLARFVLDGEIIVRSKDIKEITFGTRESDFFKQVAQLDLIVETGHVQADHPALSINLAVGGSQVPVVFEKPAVSAPGVKTNFITRPVAPTPAVRSEPRRPSAIFTTLYFPSREL